ncbi:MAG: AAA family ATPase [Bacteriovoracia bacterium]
MFIGRNEEIHDLEKLYNEERSSFVVVYGRRRIGKSSLIDKFCSNKSSMRFEGIEGEHSAEQITQFQRDLKKQVDDKFLKQMNFSKWEDIFDYMTVQIKKSEKKLVLFFDEFQWMAASQSKLVSLLKKVWDNDWKKTQKVMLVLCGSVAPFMIRKVIKSNALYGRIDYELCLKGLGPKDVKKLIGGSRSIYEIFKYILILGGVPRYIEIINSKKSFEQNIQNLFFKSNSLLLSEYEKIFYSQFREHKNYEKIVKYLSNTPRNLQEISKHLKMESSGGVKSYLDNLEKALFVTSYVPYDRPDNSKLKKYKLSDEYIRFYLKYVYPNQKKIQSAPRNQSLFKTLVKDQWDSWLGFAFENFCLKNAYLLARKMGFADQVKNYGPFFSKGSKDFQIDLVFERFDNVITVCEMKYYNKKITTGVIAEVEKKLELLNIKKGMTVEKALISQFGADEKLAYSDYFHHYLTIEQIME